MWTQVCFAILTNKSREDFEDILDKVFRDGPQKGLTIF